MTLSRRDLIVGVGAGVPAVAAVPSLAHAAVRRVGIAPEARQAVGVIGTIEQDGLHLTGFGWLTQVRGLSAHDLFTDPARRGAETARLRWHAEVTVSSIDVLPSLFFGTGGGRLRIFYASDGGAQPGQPDTFATGRLVASYGCLFRNIQTVIAPDHAVTEIIGELTQRTARRFVVRGRHRQLGRKGLLARLDASGSAIRTEPTIPRSTRYVAGGITVPR
jgi:hypothetical protein